MKKKPKIPKIPHFCPVWVDLKNEKWFGSATSARPRKKCKRKDRKFKIHIGESNSKVVYKEVSNWCSKYVAKYGAPRPWRLRWPRCNGHEDDPHDERSDLNRQARALGARAEVWMPCGSPKRYYQSIVILEPLSCLKNTVRIPSGEGTFFCPA